MTTKEITSWLNKGERNLIGKILDTSNIGKMAARLASFHVAFQPNEQKAISAIKDTLSSNIGDIIKELHIIGLVRHERDETTIRGRGGFNLEKELDPRIFFALNTTDGSTEDIIKAFMDMLGYTEKKGNEMLVQLTEKGLIHSEDGGKHYIWSRDSELKFKR
jgi:hypothetical protein